MFEFHGWASIHYHVYEIDERKQDSLWRDLTDYVASNCSRFATLTRYNGCDSCHTAGQRNHRTSHPFELFEWIALHAPGSYGLLYVRDDEDDMRGSDFTNCFRAWRLCRGIFAELDDPFLSPAIPVVEDPTDLDRDDF